MTQISMRTTGVFTSSVQKFSIFDVHILKIKQNIIGITNGPKDLRNKSDAENSYRKSFIFVSNF